MVFFEQSGHSCLYYTGASYSCRDCLNSLHWLQLAQARSSCCSGACRGWLNPTVCENNMCTGSGCITVSQTFPTVQELCCGDVTGGAPAITRLLTSTYCPEQVQNTKRTGLDPKLLSIYTLSTCCNYHGVRCLSTHTRHPCMSTRQRCNAAGASCANGMPHSIHTTASGSVQQLRLASTAGTTHNQHKNPLQTH